MRVAHKIIFERERGEQILSCKLLLLNVYICMLRIYKFKDAIYFLCQLISFGCVRVLHKIWFGDTHIYIIQCGYNIFL